MAELTEAAEAVEEVAEEIVKVVGMVDRRLAIIAIGLTAAVSTAVGYYIADRRLRKKYTEVAEAEIEEMRVHFRKRLVARETKPEISSLGKTVEELGYAPTPPEERGPGDLNTAEGVEDRTERNVFDTAKVEDNWDYAAEKLKRDPGRPYVIHVDERGESGYEEITLTYYAGDDVLCDNDDKVVDDKDRVVGEVHLDMFGHGSKDAAIVYVRNEYLNLDIEVVRSEQTYAEEVHGIKHADDPRRRDRPQWR